MSDSEKIKSLLGFANKAGKLAIGRTALKNAHKEKRLYLVLISDDASSKLLDFASVAPAYRFSTTSELGRLVGREKVAIAGICDAQFASAIKKHLSPQTRIDPSSNDA